MAKPVTVNIPHELGRDEALRRVRKGFGKFEQAIGMGLKLEHEETADGMAFTAGAMGQTVRGDVAVDDSAISITVELPMLLSGMAGKLADVLSSQGRLLLEKPKGT